MKLSQIPRDYHEARAMLAEKAAAAQMLGFDYPNYDEDPKPNVLLLGTWQNRDTGNTLVGGINLNYLNRRQLSRLRVASKRIMEPHDLRGRYWAGRKILPDIFKKYYRTYNAQYIRALRPDQLDAPELKQQQDANKNADAAKQAQLAAQSQNQQPQQTPDQIAAQQAMDAAKTAQAHQVYQQPMPQPTTATQMPSQGQPQVGTIDQPPIQQQPAPPTKLPGVGVNSGNVVPPTAPVGKPAAHIDDLHDAPQPKQHINVEPEPEEIEEKPLPTPEKQEVPAEDCSYGKSGALWRNPEAYRRWHTISNSSAKLGGATVLEAGPGDEVLAVFDARRGEIYVDKVHDHIEIMSEAMIPYKSAIRLAFVNGFVTAEYDNQTLGPVADLLISEPALRRLARRLSVQP